MTQIETHTDTATWYLKMSKTYIGKRATSTNKTSKNSGYLLIEE